MGNMLTVMNSMDGSVFAVMLTVNILPPSMSLSLLSTGGKVACILDCFPRFNLLGFASPAKYIASPGECKSRDTR